MKRNQILAGLSSEAGTRVWGRSRVRVGGLVLLVLLFTPSQDVRSTEVWGPVIPSWASHDSADDSTMTRVALLPFLALRVEGRHGFAWVDQYVLRRGRYWTELSENGDILYLRLGTPGTNAIEEVRRGTLQTNEAAKLFRLLESIGFFRMATEDPVARGMEYEGDVLTVFACVRDQHNKVSSRPPGFVPPGLSDFVRALEHEVQNMPPQSGEQLFLRAEEISQERQARLRARGTRFSTIGDEQLGTHPSLKEALDKPGRFVALDSGELNRLANVIPDRRSSFIARPSPFHIQVFRVAPKSP